MANSISIRIPPSHATDNSCNPAHYSRTTDKKKLHVSPFHPSIFYHPALRVVEVHPKQV